MPKFPMPSLPDVSAQNLCLPLPPGSEEFSKDVYQEWGIGGIVFLTIPPVLTFITLLMFGECVYFIIKKCKSSQLRNKLIWVMTIQPAIMVSGTISIFIPRALLYLTWLFNTYVAIAIFKFYYLLMEFPGHTASFIEKTNGKEITANHLPCCCLICLPKMTNSRKAAKFAKFLVLQNAILTPLYGAIAIVLKEDLKLATRENLLEDEASIRATVLALLKTISTITSLYGFLIVAKFVIQIEGMEALHRVRGKTVCILLTNLITGVEPNIFTLLSSQNVFSCVKPLDFKAGPSVILNYAIVCQAFLIFLLQRRFYRREKDFAKRDALTAHSSTSEVGKYPVAPKESTIRSDTSSTNNSFTGSQSSINAYKSDAL